MSDTDSNIDAYATNLADAVEAQLQGWLERCVYDATDAQGHLVTGDMKASTSNMSGTVSQQYATKIRELLMQDIDSQNTTPMALLRQSTIGPTQVLAQYGVPAIERDDFVKAQFPDDHYGLVPSTFGDVHPDLAGPGLAWGAAKAFLHKERHRPS